MTDPNELPVPPPPRRFRVDALVAVLFGVAVGVGIAAAHRPQLGMFVVAAALGVGGLMRLVLRPHDAGLLVVRSRQFDAAVLLLLAAALAVLAAVTPFPHERL